MRFLHRAVAIGGLLAAAHGTSAAAQSVAPRAEPTSGAVADSMIWDRVLVHLWETFAHELRTASLDARPVAWTMSFPASGLPWARVEAHLRLALRARQPVPADSVVRTLEFGAITIANDTARVTIITDHALRCPGDERPGGWRNTHDVIVPYFRDGGTWGVARTRSVRHADRFGCRRRSR